MFQNMTQIMKTKLLIMIPNEEDCHYHAVKNSALLRGTRSKHH